MRACGRAPEGVRVLGVGARRECLKAAERRQRRCRRVATSSAAGKGRFGIRLLLLLLLLCAAGDQRLQPRLARGALGRVRGGSGLRPRLHIRQRFHE